MQRFPCPFCGHRPEFEFLFITEMGKTRPEPAEEVSAPVWAAYLHAVKNIKGEVAEIWQHLACGQLFLMRRDTTTMEVQGVQSLRTEARQ
jgi:sarcosine oxidase subunit delta